MVQRVTTHLMFLHDDAQAALDLYRECFDDFDVVELEQYGPDEAGTQGAVRFARFTLAGREFSCIDSPVRHDFDFTPAVSLFVDCTDNDELERVAAQLGEGGEALMPLGDYGFSRRFTWISDRFGVSWQLNLP
jgi:predicted 3-demethylubiquinone-9 3-methyltransferase (glyoxalase superfamily)